MRAISSIITVVAIAGAICCTIVPSHAQQCQENHNHYDPAWTNPIQLRSCPWQGQLEWCVNDGGYNEGAAKGVALALQAGLGLDPTIANAGGAVVGNIWPRRDMMNFAKAAARTGNPTAADIAIACQWHNCHAFRCLAAHRLEVQGWLMTH